MQFEIWKQRDFIKFIEIFPNLIELFTSAQYTRDETLPMKTELCQNTKNGKDGQMWTERTKVWWMSEIREQSIYIWYWDTM